MDGFVVFAPVALDQADARIDVGDDLPVNVLCSGFGLVESPRWHDGRLVLVSNQERALLTLEDDGSLATYADLG